MVGLPGFEPGSREPKSPSLDQASRQPLLQSLEPLHAINDFGLIIKTLSKLQRLSKTNQKAIWNSSHSWENMSTCCSLRQDRFDNLSANIANLNKIGNSALLSA